MNTIITIGRQFGSGGHSIGEKVAKQLGIPFWDGEIVNKVVEEHGYARELIEEQGETTSQASKWFDISAASAMEKTIIMAMVGTVPGPIAERTTEKT